MDLAVDTRRHRSLFHWGGCNHSGAGRYASYSLQQELRTIRQQTTETSIDNFDRCTYIIDFLKLSNMQWRIYNKIGRWRAYVSSSVLNNYVET